ncbi:MAG: CHAT domain-containing protein [Acidobacteria bacterium]|nr:CHAT domain-containing protein [Acidobacteriota bacterium]
MTDLRWELSSNDEKTLRIAGGTPLVGTWAVPGGHTGRLYAEQRGLDVEVRLKRPGDEEPLRLVDGMNGEWGTERLIVTVEEDTQFDVEIRPLSPTALQAEVLLRSEVRPTSDRDRLAARADRDFDLGERHRRKKPPHQEALPLFEQALEGFTAAGDDPARLDCLQRLAWVNEQLGRSAEARDRYLELLEASRSLSRRKEEGDTLNRLGRVALNQGQYSEAEGYFTRALQLAAKEKDEVLRIRTLHNQAAAAALREDLATALARLSEVRQAWRNLNNPQEEAASLLNLSTVLKSQGRYEDAVDSLEEAMALRKGLNDREGVIFLLVELGDIRRLQGNLAKAEAHLEKALELHSGVPDDEIQLRLLNNLGLVLTESGRTVEAAEAFKHVIPAAQSLNLSRHEAMAALNLAAIRQEEGKGEESLELLARARTLFEALGDPRNLAACSLLEGLGLRGRGQNSEALAKLAEAAGQVEALRSEQEGWGLRMAFFATRQSYYDEWIELLVEQHRTTGDPALLQQALSASERRRARSLLDAVSERRLRFDGNPELLERERSIVEAQAELEREIRRAESPVPPDLELRLRQLFVELETVRTEIHRSSPQYSELTRYEPLPIDGIRKEVLDPETRLLAYSLGEERSFLFTLGRDDELHVFDLPGRQRIRTAVEEARTAFKSVNPRRWSLNRQALQALSDLLLGPITDSLDDRRLAVVADGPLQTVPFGALLEPSSLQKEGDPPRWLLQRRQVVHLPSASFLAALRRERHHLPTRAPYGILAFGDPVFSSDDERFSEASKAPAGRSANAGTSLSEADPSAMGPWRGSDSQLYRLESSSAEIEEIRRLFGDQSNRFLKGFAANRKAFEQIDIEEFRVLHFATHGFLDTEHPELSGLVLSMVDPEGKPVDGFIRTHEIYARSLRADLAVLSACQTGLGKEVEGEGLVGLPRGFLYAGVPRVVVSLWNVNDASTAQLMSDLYRHLGDGKSPVEALRQAQLAMLHSSEFAAPYFWAPFVFLGDWRAGDDRDGSFGQEDPGTVILTLPGKGTSYGIDGSGTPRDE